ncbi:hypothetical protein Agabi119p4_9763 [Agaricus bisporus var. burnettii]|uniref:Uncharacterized protein n=1 Tax=Agaricus bisporus var. burnettii TaxID=192524 RepID=A0A8H7EX47_AGABI|nr:hypothetical protein Agabi119p4_9763 [Agaricus bisporus var. burnettii]
MMSCDMLNFCFEHNIDPSSSPPSFLPSPSSPSPFLALQACNLSLNHISHHFPPHLPFLPPWLLSYPSCPLFSGSISSLRSLYYT